MAYLGTGANGVNDFIWDITFQVDFSRWKKALCCLKIGKNEIGVKFLTLKCPRDPIWAVYAQNVYLSYMFPNFLLIVAKLTLSMEIWVHIYTLGVLEWNYIRST